MDDGVIQSYDFRRGKASGPQRIESSWDKASDGPRLCQLTQIESI